MNRRPRSYQERALPLSYLGQLRRQRAHNPILYNTIPPYVVEGVGFEPTKPFRTPDLQSGGFNHSPTPPGCRGSSLPPAAPSFPRRGVPRAWIVIRAPEGSRTPNLSITSRLRYLCATGASKTLGGGHTTNGPGGGAISPEPTCFPTSI